MMRRVLICVVVFLVVAGVTRALFHGVFDALGIDYEPTGGSRSDPKNPPGEFIAALASLAIPALATVLVYRWLDRKPVRSSADPWHPTTDSVTRIDSNPWPGPGSWPPLTAGDAPGSDRDLRKLGIREPGPIPWVPSSTPLANWYLDPSGQYEVRYWDGGRWTEHVSTGGVHAVSPIPET